MNEHKAGEGRKELMEKEKKTTNLKIMRDIEYCWP